MGIKSGESAPIERIKEGQSVPGAIQQQYFKK
jgi:hypothetical protein